ncbi:hypothetical protein MTR_7g055993 [Medicago truncatula]|uniref:Uncharacterized protein n=1 Tax=Medicago truncatula TaxID=3880 RepID=A0A072TZG5_MEDTR|nr:hypothetical protein MTR_7g055993 [Medicago truncatula]
MITNCPSLSIMPESKSKDKKVNGTGELLTQFDDNTPTLRATKPRRKSTSVFLALSSQQTPSSQLITKDLPVFTSTEELLDLRFHLTSTQSHTL